MSTPIPKAISGPDFFQELDPIVAAHGGVAHFFDGDLHYAALDSSSRMRVVLRTAEELFESTIRRAQSALRFKAAINGNYYDVSSAGLMDAFVGHDPVPAEETTPKGLVVDKERVIAGTNEPDRFFIAFQPPVGGVDFYKFDKGDPPTRSQSALGGLGPLVINKQKFGSGNKYSSGVPAGAPAEGQPGPEFLPFLTQRNNNNYRALAKLGPKKGKVVVAHAARRKLLLIVQPDASPVGIELDALRDKLLAVSVENAVFLDGSDSALLMVNSELVIAQGENKDETNRVGLGFG